MSRKGCLQNKHTKEGVAVEHISDAEDTVLEEKAYAYWLHSLPGVGNRSIRALLNRFGSAREVYREASQDKSNKWSDDILTEKQKSVIASFKGEWEVEKEYRKLKACGVSFLYLGEPEYPVRLSNIPDAPYGLFLKGKLPKDDILSVAIIGARECSEYGKFTARELGRTLGSNGVQVISGMARGIDGISQMGAQEAGGVSYAVLGCGVDVCYPSSNRPLYDQLVKEGGIISSYPPGTQPQAGLFPPRNRIVSGLADVVVVVEARQKSGTLITVDMALEQGREVYAVPGRITDRLSDGCNRLIKQGAGVVLSPDSFLQEMSALFPDKKTIRKTADNTIAKAAELAGIEVTGTGKMTSAEKLVMSRMDMTPISVEQIRKQLPPSFTYQRTISLLMQLCLKGKVIQVGAGYFRRQV